MVDKEQQESPLHPLEENAATMNKQTKTKVKFSVLNETTQGVQVTISDSELTSQYATESPTSPVLTSSRKRKRFNENSTPISSRDRWSSVQSAPPSASQDSVEEKLKSPALLDPFRDVDVLLKSNILSSATAPPPNPFVKHSNEGNDLSPRTYSSSSNLSAVRVLSQMKTKDSDGQEIVTSAYFQSEKNIGDQTTLTTETVIKNSHATQQQFKPVLSSKEISSTPKQVTS